MTGPKCFYCERTGEPLEACCDKHPDDLVCVNRADCRDFVLASTSLRARRRKAKALQALI